MKRYTVAHDHPLALMFAPMPPDPPAFEFLEPDIPPRPAILLDENGKAAGPQDVGLWFPDHPDGPDAFWVRLLRAVENEPGCAVLIGRPEAVTARYDTLGPGARTICANPWVVVVPNGDMGGPEREACPSAPAARDEVMVRPARSAARL